MDLNLNEKQKIAVIKINEFISQNNDKVFYLMGYAGTGKTFVISKVVKDFIINNKMDHVFVCAPTHKALNVIESYLKSNFDSKEKQSSLSKLSFMTIHKLLEFKPVIIAKDGSKMFKSHRESKFLKQMENKLIIIDECSMISKEMVNELKKYIELYPIKIIFIGDRKQLPPVGESESLIFKNIPDKYEFHILLDEIMRTKYQDIKEVCSIIRNWDQKDKLFTSLVPIHNKKSKVKSFKLYRSNSNYTETSWFKKFINCLNCNDIPIILTWKNIISDEYNKLIRKYVHKSSNIDNYIIGDYAMFNNYYSSPVDGTNFYTSDMIKILEIDIEEKMLFEWEKLLIEKPNSPIDESYNVIVNKIINLKNKFKVDILTVERIHSDIISILHNDTYIIQTIHRDDLDAYHQLLNDTKKYIEIFFKKYKSETLTNKLWDIYHKKLINPYAEINFGYSITVYKSQGSTFETVFVDIEDINSLRDMDELQKALYTAAGRASSDLGFIVK